MSNFDMRRSANLLAGNFKKATCNNIFQFVDLLCLKNVLVSAGYAGVVQFRDDLSTVHPASVFFCRKNPVAALPPGESNLQLRTVSIQHLQQRIRIKNVTFRNKCLSVIILFLQLI